MKKTLLASAILLAGAANAAEVYNNDGSSVTVGGSFRGHVAINSTDDVKFKDAGSRFDIQAAKVLGNGLTAIGVAEIKHNDFDLYLNKSYVGLASDTYGTATLGKQYGLNDDLVYNDFSYEAGVYNENNETLGSDANNQLKYVKGFGGAQVVVSVMDQDTYALGGTYTVGGLQIGGSYNIANDRAEYKNVTTTVDKVDFVTREKTGLVTDNSTYIVGAQYTIDALTLGAKVIGTDVADVKSNVYGIGAKYAFGQASVYAMYDKLDGDLKAQEGHAIVAGADYAIADGVVAYAEFSSNEAGNADSDEGLLLGGRFYF